MLLAFVEISLEFVEILDELKEIFEVLVEMLDAFDATVPVSRLLTCVST